MARERQEAHDDTSPSNFTWSTLTTSLIVLMLYASWPELALAGCRITLYVQNPGKNDLHVMNYVKNSRVKSRGGTWRGLHLGGWFEGVFEFTLVPGQKKGATYSAGFGCKAKRRYVIAYRCTKKKSDPIFYTYYPSATDWTTSTRLTVPLRECG